MPYCHVDLAIVFLRVFQGAGCVQSDNVKIALTQIDPLVLAGNSGSMIEFKQVNCIWGASSFELYPGVHLVWMYMAILSAFLGVQFSFDSFENPFIETSPACFISN